MEIKSLDFSFLWSFRFVVVFIAPVRFFLFFLVGAGVAESGTHLGTMIFFFLPDAVRFASALCWAVG